MLRLEPRLATDHLVIDYDLLLGQLSTIVQDIPTTELLQYQACTVAIVAE